MQEAHDKTQRKDPKTTTYNNQPNPRLFYPSFGFAGLVDALAFKHVTLDKAPVKTQEEELRQRISNTL